jgi:glucose/arabinose dehydrogenase
LASKDVRKLSISNGQVEEEILFSDLDARIRNIYQTPKGSLILLVDGPDGRVIEVTK